LRITFNGNEISLMVIGQVCKNGRAIRFEPMNHSFFTAMSKRRIS
jgi:hypothetical protein